MQWTKRPQNPYFFQNSLRRIALRDFIWLGPVRETVKLPNVLDADGYCGVFPNPHQYPFGSLRCDFGNGRLAGRSVLSFDSGNYVAYGFPYRAAIGTGRGVVVHGVA